MFHAAVIGLGNIGLQFDIPRKVMPQSHALAYELHPDIELTAACGVRQEQGEKLALLAPNAAFYLDLPTMLRSHRLDIVSICTPSHIRLELLRTVLEHSAAKVIFLEKPVAVSLEEAEQVAELFNRHGDRTVLVNLSRRWSDGAAQMREAVRSGRYGKLKKIHLRYTRGIYNYGSHLFDLVRFVAGPIDQVRVLRQVSTNLDERKDWTYSFAFQLEEGGITGYAEAFDDRDYLVFEMDLYFEQGKIEMLRTGDEIRFYTTELHPMLGGFRNLVLERTEEQLLSRSSNIQNAVGHIVDILRGEAEPVSTIEDGIFPMYVAEALLESHRNGGTTVRVKDTV
ncbi:Gfo/Idh/MocA family protein [Paenibacillus sp. MBLB4367]|uniref:Gfo/Idh/MocA family protein n=1 Tax=Paenibacillus sp. MBLB4367 TaxID=3384767 RepID=UPI0039080E1B